MMTMQRHLNQRKQNNSIGQAIKVSSSSFPVVHVDLFNYHLSLWSEWCQLKHPHLSLVDFFQLHSPWQTWIKDSYRLWIIVLCIVVEDFHCLEGVFSSFMSDCLIDCNSIVGNGITVPGCAPLAPIIEKFIYFRPFNHRIRNRSHGVCTIFIAQVSLMEMPWSTEWLKHPELSRCLEGFIGKDDILLHCSQRLLCWSFIIGVMFCSNYSGLMYLLFHCNLLSHHQWLRINWFHCPSVLHYNVVTSVWIYGPTCILFFFGAIYMYMLIHDRHASGCTSWYSFRPLCISLDFITFSQIGMQSAVHASSPPLVSHVSKDPPIIRLSPNWHGIATSVKLKCCCHNSCTVRNHHDLLVTDIHLLFPSSSYKIMPWHLESLINLHVPSQIIWRVLKLYCHIA